MFLTAIGRYISLSVVMVYLVPFESFIINEMVLILFAIANLATPLTPIFYFTDFSNK